MYFVNENGVRLALPATHQAGLASPPVLELESFAVGHEHAQFDLTLMCAESKNDLVASFHYNTALFDESTIGRMSEHFINLLKAVVANNGDTNLSSMVMISPVERRLLVNEFNDTQREAPLDKLVHEYVTSIFYC